MSLAQTFRALSDPNRQKIIDILKQEELPVSDIGLKLSITLPTLSHHLDILKRAGLVSSRREGQKIYYAINLSVLEELTEQIIKFLK